MSSGNTVAGNYITNTAQGVFVDNEPNNTIGGSTLEARNVIGSNDVGVVISGSGNVVEGNYIGTDGTRLLAGSGHGIKLNGATQTVISGNVVAAGGSWAIRIDDFSGNPSDANVVQGNYVGLDNTGSRALASPGEGIWVFGSRGNLIGGTTSEARNVIAGYGESIVLEGGNPDQLDWPGNNVVEGNYVGTNAAGTSIPTGLDTALAAVDGIDCQDADNTIGGTTPGAGNLISGNQGAGVSLEGPGNVVQGNVVGTDYTGTKPVPNGQGIVAGSEVAGSVALIGGLSPGAGNLVAFNNGPGVWVFGDPVLGYSAGNSIEGNAIYGNAGRGIVLADVVDAHGNPIPDPYPTGTPNGPQTWGNDSQVYPVLTAANSFSTSTVVTGTFSEAAEPNTTLTLDFYGNPAADPSGYGQGQTYLGSRTVVTDSNGDVGFTADLAVGGLAGDWISATATDQNGNTSEFSQDIQATSAPNQTFAQSLAAALPQSTTSPNTLTIQADTASINDVVSGLSTSNLGSSVVPVSVYVNLAPGTYQPQTIQAPQGMTVYINGQPGTIIDPASSAFTVVSGSVVVSNATFVTTGDAPTILVTGGSLTLRDDVVQESTGFSDAAISVTGGTVDLGTASAPGGNTIIVNGAGTFLRNTTGNPISAFDDTFEMTVTASNSVLLAGNNPPPLTGSVNGTPFTGTISYPTGFGSSVTVTLSTAATSASAVGQYPISAQLSAPNDGNSYVLNPATSATGTMYAVSVGPDPDGSGAQAVTFWASKGNARLITAADLSSLDALNLVTQGGSAFDPHSVAQLQAWLSVSRNATAAYQLAVQLAAMDLNVLAGYVQATDLVYAGGLLPYATADHIAGLTSGGFLDVQDLMQAANAALAQVGPGNPSGDPNAAYELALAQALQAANGNGDFVSQELIWGLLGL